MMWPIPKAKNIAARMAGKLEARLIELRPHIEASAISRAVRSARGVLASLLRTISIEIRTIHDHVRWWVKQWFPDTADDEAIILRHADIWGIERREATKATGSIAVSGVAETVILEGTIIRASGAVDYVVDAQTIIDQTGSVDIAVTALVAGETGNLEEGIQLSLVTANSAITGIVVAEGGLLGGAEIETPESLQQRYLAEIREPAHGGAGFDYPRWLKDAFDIHAVKTIPDWIGRGSVGVVTTMKDGLYGRAPNEDEINAQLIYLGRPGTNEGVRPVTAHVVMIAGVAEEQPLRIRLRPDTPSNRLAIENAWKRFVATIGDEADTGNDGPIGATIEVSRLSEALSAAQGEYAHDLLEPSANIVLGPTHFATAGVVVFEAAE